MDKGTGGDVLERKGVTGLDIRGLACDYLVAYLKTLGRDDVRLVAVLILDQRDERGAVGIVLDGLNDTFYVKFMSLEINNTVFSPVAAASVTHGDTTVAVTTAVLPQRFEQALFGSDLGKSGEIRNRHITSCVSCRLINLNSHVISLSS